MFVKITFVKQFCYENAVTISAFSKYYRPHIDVWLARLESIFFSFEDVSSILKAHFPRRQASEIYLRETRNEGVNTSDKELKLN